MTALQFLLGLALLAGGTAAVAGWPVAAIVVGVLLVAPTCVRTLRRPGTGGGDR